MRTKNDYEEYLNDLGVPESDKKSNGGLIPDRTRLYGSWLRKNDSIMFEVTYNEWKNER